jgi:hypothetical protein
MKLLFVLLGAMLFVAGCAGPAPSNGTAPKPPPQPPAPPANVSPPPTCTEYCQTQPHIQCVGSWKISGTYPNCVCVYECETTQINETPPAPPPPPEPLATPTNKSIPDMLEGYMEKQQDDFYKSNDGTFDQRFYTWIRTVTKPPPDEKVIIGTAPADDVKFDGKVIQSIEAFGYTVFENQETEVRKAYGAAIFKAKSTILDSYTGSDAFDIDYFNQKEDGLLKDCWVYTRDYNVNTDNEWLVSYLFRCEKVADKED